MMNKEIENELVSHILPFWMGLKDDKYGGFYGEVSFDKTVNPYAIKGGILHSRILWFFSNAYLTLKNKEYLAYADHAYHFIKDKLYDPQYGGVYWTVTHDGKPDDTCKHTYNLAFAIYALSSYYNASGSQEALTLAYKLFDTIEARCRDDGGYLEAFERDFKPSSNEKLSENGVMAGRTMNTLLHLIEAYTELYRVDQQEKVAACLRGMLDTLAERVYNPELGRLEVFFDLNWNSLIDLHSYGHDIEASWLVDRACEVLAEKEYTDKISRITKALAEKIHSIALDSNSSVYNECERGVVDKRKIWWVQAEAVVGFVNAYQKDKSRTDYLDTARRIWSYIRQYVIDPREGSEWFNELYPDGTPIREKEIAGLWKCPYHNGRMCFELINRNINIR